MTCKDCGWKSVNSSGAIFCDYTNSRTWEDESCCAWKPISIGITPYTDEDWKKTNADRVRAMSDEELAEWIHKHDCHTNLYGYDSKEAILDWMKKEIE